MIDSGPDVHPSLLFVNSIRFWGGGEQWFLQTATALAERGYEVCVAGRRDGVFLERMESAGLPSLRLRMTSDFSPNDYLQLRRWVNGRRNVRVLCNLSRDIRVAGPASRVSPGSRVLWVMGSILLRNRWRDRFWTRRYVDQFIVPSQALAGELGALDYIDARRIKVLPIGLELERWTEDQGTDVSKLGLPGTPKDTLTVGVFGRLETRKGHEVLLRAWPSVRDGVPNARLWIVGAGQQDERLKELAKPYGQSVRFWGHVNDIRPIMRAVDIVVQPSLYEPFGITLLEAMACAKPIVCTSVGGMPEVVNESCAVIVPPGDPDQLGKATAGLLIDGERAHAMGRSGRRRVEEHFALDVMIDRLESLLTVDERRFVPNGRH